MLEYQLDGVLVEDHASPGFVVAIARDQRHQHGDVS
jgi:hypothetical protein